MHNSFDRRYNKLVYSALPTALAREQVAFIIKKLGLKKEMRILDVGCGNGRHSLEFARRGFVVTGVDFSKDLVAIAKKEARKQKLNIKFIHGDMRKISFTEEFDVAISIFSFGFLNRRGDHKVVLKKIASSLKKGGKLILATGNSLVKIRDAAKYGVKKSGLIVRESKRTLSGGIIITEKNMINTKTSRQTIKNSWKEQGRTYEMISTMHLFAPHEIKNLIKDSGFKFIEARAGFDNSRFSKGSKRLVVSAIKK